MKKYFWWVFIAIIIIGGGSSIYFFAIKNNTQDVEFIEAKHDHLLQTVEATGRVKAQNSVELTFERPGKVTSIEIEAGDSVKKDDLLIILDTRDIDVDISRADAALDTAKADFIRNQALVVSEEARLSEINKGTRYEELVIAEANVSKNESALVDARSNLKTVESKADIDLSLYIDDIPSLIKDAYITADDAVKQHTDQMFSSAWSDNPQLNFAVFAQGLESIVESERRVNNIVLNDFQELTNTILITEDQKLEALSTSITYLNSVISFLDNLSDAVTFESDLSDATAESYQLGINTGRLSVSSDVSTLTTLGQSISLQRITNEQNILSANTSVNKAKNALIISQAELDLARAGATDEQIDAKRAEVQQAKANVIAAGAKVKEAEASLKSLEVEKGKFILASPFDGIITDVTVEVGETAQLQEVAVRLSADTFFEVEVRIPEADITKVVKGDLANITTDAYGDSIKFPASVFSIDPAEKIVDGIPTYKTILIFDNEDERLRSGMTANIIITTEDIANTLIIPSRAVIYKGEKRMIRILEAGVIKEIEIETGIKGSEGTIEALSGVKEGDKIITFINE